MNKSDLKIMQSNKKAAKKSEKPDAVAVSAPDDSVNFDSWWSEMAKVKRLPIYLKEVVSADFKSRGLNKGDSKSKFDAALKVFGY